jgi:predicted GH43/DUF377 family glycosyl hydrolase
VTVQWERRGLVFRPDGERAWMRSHASLPVVRPLDGDLVRVFFASRDAEQRSHVGFADVDLGSLEVRRVAEQPVLAPGPLGCFDDHGVYPASLVDRGDELWLYYIGWNPGKEPPLFYASIGLAVSRDGGESFSRASAAPLVARGEHDPCLVTAPCVLREEDRWRMYYVSGLRWERGASGLESYYHVKYAESADGLDWRRAGTVAIELEPGERNIGRPCVLPGYRMWYGHSAGEGYRLGYAESADGIAWTRLDDEAGLEPAADGWDSEAIAYPHVFEHGGRLHMLYNGNGFGRDGFGLAVAA